MTDDPESVDAAREVALRILTAAPQATAAIASKLAQRGFNAEVIAEVIERLTRVGLLDDLAYARGVVRDRRDGARRSRRAIAEELGSKGIDNATATEALGDYSSEDEIGVASALLARKSKGPWSQLSERDRRRIYGMLARRGFAHDVIAQAIRTDQEVS